MNVLEHLRPRVPSDQGLSPTIRAMNISERMSKTPPNATRESTGYSEFLVQLDQAFVWGATGHEVASPTNTEMAEELGHVDSAEILYSRSRRH